MAMSRAEKLRLANLRRQKLRKQIVYEDPAEAIHRRITNTSSAMQRIGALAGAGIVGVGLKGLGMAARVADVSAYPGMYAAKAGLKLLAKERKDRIAARQEAMAFEQHTGIIDLQPSSLVHYLFYHTQEHVIQTRLNGVNYYYTNVPPGVIEAWKHGATCRTNDPSNLNRWWVDKTGSLGAFFNQYIKGHYQYHRGTFRP